MTDDKMRNEMVTRMGNLTRADLEIELEWSRACWLSQR